MTVCWLGVRDPGFAGWLAHWGYVAVYVAVSGRESWRHILGLGHPDRAALERSPQRGTDIMCGPPGQNG